MKTNLKIDYFKIYLFMWYFLLGLGALISITIVAFGVAELILAFV